MTLTEKVNSLISSGEGNDGNCHIAFNAQQDNGIYGKSDTVQPPVIQLIPQIKFQYFICGNKDNVGGCTVSPRPYMLLLLEAANFKLYGVLGSWICDFRVMLPCMP